MNYKLTFLKSAKKEWYKLTPTVKNQFKNKLIQRLKNPCIQKDKLAGLTNCYKIKLRASGYRLVYKVIAIGKRDKEEVYKLAHYPLN